jgi:hypothetical protein
MSLGREMSQTFTKNMMNGLHLIFQPALCWVWPHFLSKVPRMDGILATKFNMMSKGL